MSLCNREASVVLRSVTVCKLLHASRYFYHTHDSIATKLAHDGPHMVLNPDCAQGQGQVQRSRDTDTFLITGKSLLLPQTWLDRHQTCTRWSPHGPASRVCSRSRSRSKVTWYGHFCDVTKWLLYSTFWRSVSTCTQFTKHRYKCPVQVSDSYRCNVYIMEWATPSLTVWFNEAVCTLYLLIHSFIKLLIFFTTTVTVCYQMTVLATCINSYSNC